MLALAGLAGGAAAIALAARNNGHFKSPVKPRSVAVGGSVRVEQGSRHLQKRLMSLLHDQRETANRLLSQAQKKTRYIKEEEKPPVLCQSAQLCAMTQHHSS